MLSLQRMEIVSLSSRRNRGRLNVSRQTPCYDPSLGLTLAPSSHAITVLAIIMVNIYLNVAGTPLSFLAIPNSEVLRLSIRPYKWIRYVMFSICGARGDISTVPNGQPVNYNSTSLADVDLCYNPSGKASFHI
jgi:hypothetical protein